MRFHTYCNYYLIACIVCIIITRESQTVARSTGGLNIKVVVVVIFIVVINEAVAVAVPSQHVVVHVNAAAVTDGVPQPVAEHLLGGIVGQTQLEETRLGRRETVLGL